MHGRTVSGLMRRIRYPYDWVRFHGWEGIGRAVRHPYYWIKHYPDRRRYWKTFAAMIAQDEAFDRKYNTDTSSRAGLVGLGIPFDSRKHAGEYACINEDVFNAALSEITMLDESYAFVDLGSGKGKALLLAAQFPFQRIVGVEFAPELSSIAESNVREFGRVSGRSVSNIECVYGDALRYELPTAPLVVFMFNPFDEPIMAPVLERIQRSLADYPRTLWIVYVNARFRALFDQVPWLTPVTSSQHYCIWQAKS